MSKVALNALLVAFFVNIVISPLIIPLLYRFKFGQSEREEGPQTHLKKAGTPTMGGILILISFIVATLFFLKGQKMVQTILIITVSFGLIGLMDDYLKVSKKNTLGLSALQKLILQVMVAAIGVWLLTHYMGINHKLIIPFTGGKRINLGFLYWPFAIFTIVGIVNAVNLTDGIDGLAASVTVLVTTFFTSVALSLYTEAVPLTTAMAGSLLSFLVFNLYPACIFMGDTGSLALGGFVASLAFALQVPLFVPIIGFVYVIETLSVILQVLYFKKTKKRLFRMAPFHHHLELGGWSETKVVIFFVILTFIMGVIGLIAL